MTDFIEPDFIEPDIIKRIADAERYAKDRPTSEHDLKSLKLSIQVSPVYSMDLQQYLGEDLKETNLVEKYKAQWNSAKQKVGSKLVETTNSLNAIRDKGHSGVSAPEPPAEYNPPPSADHYTEMARIFKN